MNDFILIFFLMIICTTVLLIISPIIDHLFYVHHKIDKMEKYKIYLMILAHMSIIGLLVLFIHYYIIQTYIKHFKIRLHDKYLKIIIDLIITLTFIGLQRNLLYKIGYISLNHPIRSKLIE